MLVKITAWTGAIVYWIGLSIVWPVGLFVVVMSLLPVHGTPMSARQIVARSQIATYLGALESFQRDVGRWPTQAEGLEALRSGKGINGWHGPYVERYWELDPWRHPYVYRVDANGVEIVSLGADGKPGGKDSNSDISSRKLNEMMEEPSRIKPLLFAVFGLVIYPFFPRLFKSASVWFLNARRRKQVA